MTSGNERKANRLIDEASPYLRRQAHSPVDWYPWGPEALERAREGDRPILLSIGFASCHWCHRMDSESFEDPEVAAFLNERFVCIRVDREERPDLDAHYMEAVRAMSGMAGYPLTAFLDPQGTAFYGGTYFPPQPQDGLPSFRAVIQDLAIQWERSRDEVVASGRQVEEQLAERRKGTPSAEALGPALLQQGTLSIHSAFDEEHGGFDKPPKFPQPSALEFMLRGAARGIAQAGTVAEMTLRKMALGGIYDQLGGGFHRYSVDREWVVPRFEKMLYDNAQLARVYTHAWQHHQEPLFRRVAEETLDYLLRDLSDPRGGLYASEDSDIDGREGGFYVWSYEEFQSVAPEAVDYYGVTPEGNFHGSNVLTAKTDDPPTAHRAALRRARAERRRPPRDENILSSWNGLAMSALAEAGAAFSRMDLVEAARRSASFILQFLRQPSGRLLHSYLDGSPGVLGMLEDYAYVGEGLFTLWEVTFEPRWIRACVELIDEMLELFWDEEGGGIFSTGSDQEQLVPRRKEYLDPSTPSAASVASLVFQKLGALTGEERYREAGIAVLEDGQRHMQGMLMDGAALLSAIDLHVSGPTEIVLLGEGGDSKTRALRREVWNRYLPNKVLAGAPPGIDCAMLKGKAMSKGLPTAFVRHKDVSRPAITDPAELGRSLKFWKSPSEQEISQATALITNALQRRHFFESLESPSWIRPLQDAGLFEAPPETVRDYAQGTVGSPPWPQSRYLAKMAPLSPEAVHRVAMEIPEGDNVLIQEDLADAALGMPLDLAVEFVPKAKDWLKTPFQLHLPEKLGELVRRLADGGRTKEAIDLATSLLELRPRTEGTVTELTAGPPEPSAGFNRFNYEEILRKDLPALVEDGQVEALEMISDLLDAAIRLSHRSGQDNPPDDYSHVWRPAIHDHELNIDRTLRNPLVSAVTEAAEQIARADPSRVPELIEALERRGWHLFRRIALSLLRVWPEVAPELIRTHLTDRHLFQDPHFHHEYLLLAREHLSELDDKDRDAILSWIKEGPDLDLWGSDPALSDVESSDEKGTERYRRLWMLKRLKVLEEALTPEYVQLLSDLSDELGQPEHPEFISYLSPDRRDPSTPKQADELRTMNAAEVAEFLRGWRPTPGLGNPTVEGLARKLAAVVASEPVRFAESANLFQGLDPRYIWGVLQGLREAAEGYSFEWQPVLELCRWTSATRPGESPHEWAPARLEAARVLSAGFTKEAVAQIPFKQRSAAWEALRPLADHLDIEVTNSRGSRPAAISAPPTGSTRAEALHAVVRYALWVRRYLEGSPNARERMARGFKEMPEVSKVLDAHLNPQADPGLASHAVYGQWFPWLLLMDPRWTSQRLRRVFVEEPSLGSLREAAWDAYITSSPPYDQLLEILESEYGRAVETVGGQEDEVQPGLGPRHRLAEHLVAFFFRGKLKPEDSRGLLSRFFENAPDSLRAHAIRFVGQTIQAQTGKLPKLFLDRLQRFWEWRLEQLTKNPSINTAELGAFGSWFAAGKFEEAWALDRLQQVLELGARVEPASEVVSRLAEVAERYPGKSVSCLARILRGQQDSVSLASWTDNARAVLTKAMQSGDSAARSQAIELLDFFDVSQVEELVRWG